ncbi:MAG: Gfo/Idh/MocA family oxidoreductase [Planctomycetaceae bacterium]|nr:Gfo/Idh/MocA family oxidoreductase [Planctomycetaceae bacterium]
MSTRRDFIKNAGLTMAGMTLLSTMGTPRVHAGEDNTVKIGLVGCGSRGTGAVIDAMDASPTHKLAAMADLHENKSEEMLKYLKEYKPEQVDVPKENRFFGFDAYRRLIDALGPGSVVFLCTPPVFRPLHFEYAVEKGLHVFMEKSFGVDVPGVKRVLKAGKAAEAKNLKVASGLMGRHNVALIEAVNRVRDGAIGDITTLATYRVHETVPFIPREKDESLLAHQLRNYHNFNWTNGTFILDWLIHNLDASCWLKGAWPVSVQGHGGRQVRDVPDQQFDSFFVEYQFADGSRLYAQGRAQNNTWAYYGDLAYGTKGFADLGGVITVPALYHGMAPTKGRLLWKYDGEVMNPYKKEHIDFFDAIKNDKPCNETEYSANATMVGILGRMAAESGQLITWDWAMNHGESLADVDQMTWDTTPPVLPDASGNYPIARPGITKPV